jgi:protein-disulfide isomerase
MLVNVSSGLITNRKGIAMSRTTASAVLGVFLMVRAASMQTSTSVEPAAAGSADPVLAIVQRTHEIHQSDVDAWQRQHAPASFVRLRQDLYDSSKQAVEALISDYLLSQQASARGMSVETLVAEQLAKTTMAPVRDEDIFDVYERSRSVMGDVTLEQAKSAIRSYLEEDRRAAARQAFVSSLIAGSAREIVMRLEAPRYELSTTADEEALGSPSAPVTLVEYSDFQCPFCKRAAPDLRRLVESYPDTVRLVWRHFPLPGHADAQSAAEAAACAGDQGAFWEYHDALFANQGSLAPADLRQHAESAGLDLALFDDCFESHRYRAVVAHDQASGDALGVSATPAIFINGRLLLGALGYDAYKRVIDEELAAIRRQGRR